MPVKQHIKVVKVMKSVSFTRYNDWVKCARFAYLKHVDKLKVEESRSAAMVRGEEIHKKAEQYALGMLKVLPKELKSFGAEFKVLKTQKPTVEGSWGFTEKWEPVSSTDWNRCKIRIKIDAAVITPDNKLRVIDHKTGKMYGDSEEQMTLYAAGGIVMNPDVIGISSELWYVDLGEEKVEHYTIAQAKKFLKTWTSNFNMVLNDRTFIPRPGRHCSWCPYRATEGGPCEFS